MTGFGPDDDEQLTTGFGFDDDEQRGFYSYFCDIGGFGDFINCFLCFR